MWMMRQSWLLLVACCITVKGEFFDDDWTRAVEEVDDGTGSSSSNTLQPSNDSISIRNAFMQHFSQQLCSVYCMYNIIISFINAIIYQCILYMYNIIISFINAMLQ